MQCSVSPLAVAGCEVVQQIKVSCGWLRTASGRDGGFCFLLNYSENRIQFEDRAKAAQTGSWIIPAPLWDHCWRLSQIEGFSFLQTVQTPDYFPSSVWCLCDFCAPNLRLRHSGAYFVMLNESPKVNAFISSLIWLQNFYFHPYFVYWEEEQKWREELFWFLWVIAQWECYLD